VRETAVCRPVDSLVAFCAPLLRVVGDDPTRVDRALTLGAALWNIGLFQDGRERQITELIQMFTGDERERETFRAVAIEMLER